MIWDPIGWLLLLFPALIALYFLKLRRREVVVSSTLLWRRSLQDFRANVPFRRLRSSWLLILQLLALAAIVASAWRPRIPGKATIGRDVVVLLDVSASTSAVEPGGTRLELEKRAALDLVDALGPGDHMTVLDFASRTTSLGAPTGDRTVLSERIRSVEATALPTDLEQALRVVASLSTTLSEPEVYVLGDGCYGDMAELPPEVKRLPLRFVGCGTRRDNLAITQADVRTSYEEAPRTEVFALLESFGESEATVVVSLELEGRLVDAREVRIAPAAAASVVFDVSGLGYGVARVFFDGRDALSLDDEAWLRIPPPRELRVLLVGQPNPWIELALRSAAGLRYERVPLAAYVRDLGGPRGEDTVGTASWDVLVFDRNPPPRPPDLPAIYVGCVPELPPGVAPPAKVTSPRLAEWDRPHPVLRFLGFTDFFVEEAYVFPPSDRYRSLVDADEGSLIGTWTASTATGRDVRVVAVGFDLLDSNWPLADYSYPLFFPNAIRWLASGEGAESARWRTGDTIVYRPPSPGEASEAVFRCPSGRERPGSVEPNGSITLSEPKETGIYELRIGGEVRSAFPVSLLSAEESRLEPSGTIDFGDFSLTLAGAAIDVARDLWKWLALLAFGLLIVEWIVYQRRAG